MTSYRGMDGVSGRPGAGSSGTQPPSAPVAYSGNFIAGIGFTVTAGGCFFEGYWYWVAAGAPTAPQKCCLWTYQGTSPGAVSQVIAGSVITSGPLSPGWNYVPLATPLPLAIGTPYIAATGVNGAFNDTQSQFSSADPYPGGITNGPLRIYSGAAGTYPAPAGSQAQATFTTATADPAAVMPLSGDSAGSGASNFWLDVQVRDTDPAGYAGSYRYQPNSIFAEYQSGTDNAEPYNLATEFRLSQPCALNRIWFYSPGGATGGLPTECAIWAIGAGVTGSIVAGDTSPVWSGAEGSGWVSRDFSGVVLPAGDYKVACYNAGGAAGSWSYKRLGWFGPFGGYRDIQPADWTWGPLTVPAVAGASAAYHYGGPPTAVPPYSDGTTEPGQCTFAFQAGEAAAAYPSLYVNDVGAAAQFYGVDVEVTPQATAPPAGSALLASFP